MRLLPTGCSRPLHETGANRKNKATGPTRKKEETGKRQGLKAMGNTGNLQDVKRAETKPGEQATGGKDQAAS